MKNGLAPAILVIGLLALGTPGVHAEDGNGAGGQPPVAGPVPAKDGGPVYWNRFRGPNGQGVLDVGEIPARIGPDVNVLWKTDVEEGQSSPVIWGDRIFLTTCARKHPDAPATVCLDRRDGKVLWRRTVSGGKRTRFHPMNGPASPTPAVDEDHLYVYFGTWGLLCYDHDGAKVWERRIDPPDNDYGMSVSPILYEDKVILVVDDNNRRSRLLAVHRETGATVWMQPRPLFRAGWSTPMIWRHDRADELIVLGTKRLTSYAPDTGEEIWWAGGFSTETIGVPVTGEGLLFVSDAADGGRGETAWDAELTWKITLEDFDRDKDGRLQRTEIAGGFRVPLRPELARHEQGFALPVAPHQVDVWMKELDKDRDGIVSREDWLSTMSAFAMRSQPTLMAIRPGARGDARPKSVVWEIHSGIPEMPSPLYCRGRIYLLRSGGWLTCIKASSGEQIYREPLGAGGQYIASPIAAGGMLITASGRGAVTFIRIGDEFEVLARSDFGEKILATPALAKDRIYLRTAGHLYAFGR